MNAPMPPPPPPQVGPPGWPTADDIWWATCWAIEISAFVLLAGGIAWLVHTLPEWIANLRPPSARTVRTICGGVFVAIGCACFIWATITGSTSLWILAVAAIGLPFILNSFDPAEPAASPAKPEPEPGSELTGEDKEWFDTWAIHYGTPPEKPTPKAPSLRKMRLRRPGDPS